MTTRRTITTTEEHVPPDLVLEGWLATLSAQPEITKVRIQRRGGDKSDWWTLPPRFHLEPPFDADLEPMYREFGDGEYRYQPVTAQGKFLGGARIERVEGYGPGTRGGKATQGVSGSGDLGAEEAVNALREMIAIQRQQMILNSLQRANMQMAPTMPADAGAGSGPMILEPPDDLDRILKLKALFDRPDPLSKVLELVVAAVPPLLQKVVAPPDSADKALDMLDKIMAIRERIGGGDSDAPWWQRFLAGFLSTEQGHAMVNMLLTPPGARSNPPTALPPPAPTPEPPAGAPPPQTDTAAAQQHFRVFVWPLIEAAAERGSEEYAVYADLLDVESPGLLATWGQLALPVALGALENLVGRPLHEPVRAWAQRFYHYVREHPPAAAEEPSGDGGAHGT